METLSERIARHRTPLAVIGLLLVGTVIVGLLSSQQPRVIPLDLSEIQKVQASSLLYFKFDQEMDQESVVENLVIPDGVRGDIDWEENTMVFTPEGELEEGSKFTFTVQKKALTQAEEPLGADKKFQFIVAGTPGLISQIPQVDDVEVPTEARITLVFDQPMIPLTQVQGEASERRLEGWNATIEPPVPGRWRWLGTTSIVYEMEEQLQPATRYTVNVPAGITNIHGDETKEDYSWSFETIRPQVESVRPFNDYGRFGPNTNLLVDFNLPIDLNSLADTIQVSEYGGEDIEGAPIRIQKPYFHQVEDENGDNQRLTSTAVVVIDDTLNFNTTYQVKVAPGARSSEGDLGTLSGYSTTLSTPGDLIIDYAVYEYYRIDVDFSNPVDEESLRESISITPEPEGWDVENITFDSWSDNQYIYLRPELKPRTTYQLRFTTRLKDVFGQFMQEPYVYEFTTPPLSPRVFIHSEGEFGLFEKEKPPVYYLNALNVSQMDLQFAPLSLQDFLNIRSQKVENYGYDPILSVYEGSQALTIEPPKNVPDEWEVVEFDMQDRFGDLESGIYGLTMSAPEYKRSYEPFLPYVEQQYFALTDMALTLKYSGSKALVWLTNTQTAEPVANAQIAFYNLAGDAPIRGQTDAQGFFETELELEDFSSDYNSYNPEFYVTATTDDDFTFVGSQWNDGMRPYNFGHSEDFVGVDDSIYRTESYVYTERPLYKAGDTVEFKGVVRMRERLTGELFVPGSSRKAVVSIEDARYQEVYNQTLDINEFGSFTGSFPIAEDASLGNYRLSLNITPGTDLGYSYGGTNFQVLAYRKPEYRVEPVAQEDDYYDDQTLRFDINGSYFFGAPLSGAEIEWRAKSTDFFFNRYTDGFYSFSLEDSWCWWNCERETETITEGTGTLDENGQFTVEFPYDLDDKSVSQIVSLEADVFDPNNQVVSARTSVPVHKSEVYVGVRPVEYVVAPGEEASVEVVTVNPDGTPKPNHRVTVTMYTREWNSIRKRGVDGKYYYENEPEDTYVDDITVTTNEEGKAIAAIEAEEGGQYRMLAEASDSAGREAKADTSVYVYSSTYVNWPRGNHDRIDVVADKPEYKVGDTAKLLVKSPFQGENVKALVTVEREQIMTREVITVESNAQSIDIPITEEMIPNAYVSVVIIKPREGETFNENGLDTGVPAFRVGYSKLLVDTSTKVTTVAIETDKQQYGPGETVNVTLKTNDWQGQPISSEVSLGVVDMSLLALTGFQMPDLIRVFYSERGLGINTSQTLLYLLERFKPGSKGGGGGEGEEEKRDNFKDTAYWNPNIRTDENGTASVSFQLPDNLTTWQLLAISNSKEHTFGAKTEEIIETKDVILRPVRPRFAVADDEIQMGAIVHNYLETSQNFTVTLAGEGFTAMDGMEQQVTIEPNGQAKLIFPVQVNYVEELTLNFTAEADGGRDQIEEKIPVYVFGTPQSVATSGQTENVIQESVLVPSEDDAKEGELSVTLSPTLASFLPDGLEYIVKYPYGCAEQIMSSFLPSVAMRSLQGFEAFSFVADEKLQDIVSKGMQSLYTLQRGDGGFGYWSGSDRSYPYLSAYILYGFHVAQQAGYTVDDDVIFRVRQYLDNELRVQDLSDDLTLATRAYILYVLSETGRVDISLANNLYESREELPNFAKSMLSMTLYEAGTNASINKAEELLDDVLNTTKVDARGTHFEESGPSYYWRGLMHTNTRTTAIVLQNLVRIEPENPLIPRIVRYLLAVREQGHWDTTQSTSMTILAFIEFLESTGELDGDFTAAVDINDDNVLQAPFNADNILSQQEVIKALAELDQGEENQVTIGKEGAGRLYYDLVMEYFYIADEIPPAEEGIGILREYEAVDVASSGQTTVGDTYKVKLTMTVPQDRHFVAVESPLAAGLEPIDLSFQTSQQDLYGDSVNQSDNDWWWNDLWYFNHTEFRDDRVVLFADYLPTGVYEYEYLVRATTPGRFRHRPARIYEMYFPETFGQTSGEWYVIEEE